MAEESMFGIANVFDSATADNVGVRDRALNVAQLQPGRATVYGATQAGGMLMQNLAGMAGMKTAQQEKTEKITSIMKSAANLDPNDPNSSMKLANEFIQAGMPGIGQKFLDKARTQGLENKRLALTERQVVVQEKAQDQSEFEFGQTFSLDKEKFGHLQYKDEAYIDIATNQDTRDQAKFDYAQVQDGIINEIRQGELTIAQARSALEQNDFEFREARALVSDEQWQSDYDIKKLISEADIAYKIATTDNVVLENQAYTFNNDIKNSLDIAKTKSLELANKIAETGMQFPETGEYFLQPIGDGKQQLVKFNLETNEYEVVKGKDGVSLGLEAIEAQSYDMTVEEQRVYDNIWAQYKQRWFKGTDIAGGGNWIEGYPDFSDWAEENITGAQGLDIIRKGNGGDRGEYNKKLMSDFNNTPEGGGTVDTVAVVVNNPDAVDGSSKSDVIVFDVDYKAIASNENININTLKDVPKKINGTSNSLTNGQHITKLIQEGRIDEAVTYVDSLPVSKSTTAETKDVVTSKFIKWRGLGTPPQSGIDSGEYIKQGGKWFIKKG
jgi:hypothetical protein